MPLIQRIAGVLRAGHRTAHSDEHTGMNVHEQLDRLADSRSIVEHDLARELRLAARLEAEAGKAMSAGAAGRAQTLSAQRDTVLVRIEELRAAHLALTDAITQRVTAQNRRLDEQFPADVPDLLTSDDSGTDLDRDVAERSGTESRATSSK
ncbi:MAG: hypothetical protein HOV83_40570 [Catenulispora sp.]|nr:hypothetical protein [Catenulispora sp.]